MFNKNPAYKYVKENIEKMHRKYAHEPSACVNSKGSQIHSIPSILGMNEQINTAGANVQNS